MWQDTSVRATSFFTRLQKSRESDDEYADELQNLARKYMVVKPSFALEVEEALINQMSNGLKEPGRCCVARQVARQCGKICFSEYRNKLAQVTGSRSQTSSRAATTTSSISTSTVDVEVSDDIPVVATLSSNQRKRISHSNNAVAAEIASLKAQLGAQQALTAQFKEVFEPSALREVITKAVVSSQVGNVRDNSRGAASASITGTGGGYKGRREQGCTKGVDGTTSPDLTCFYCKDTGHNLDNCGRLAHKQKCVADGTWRYPQTIRPRTQTQNPN